MSQTDRLLAEISRKMDKMLRLLALETVKGIAAEQGKIELLDLLGFRPIEIAEFLNKSTDNVNVQLSIIRKKKEKATKKAAEKAEIEKSIEETSSSAQAKQPEEGNKK